MVEGRTVRSDFCDNNLTNFSLYNEEVNQSSNTFNYKEEKEMKRFWKMMGMLVAETVVGIAALYGMLAVTAWMYWEDIIVETSTFDAVTNIVGTFLIVGYLVISLTTVYTTVKRCVYEIGTKEE